MFGLCGFFHQFSRPTCSNFSRGFLSCNFSEETNPLPPPSPPLDAGLQFMQHISDLKQHQLTMTNAPN